MQLADKNKKPLVVGVTVQLRWGNATIKGKVTGLDVEQGRVVLLDNFKGKGSRGEFSVEAHAVEIVAKTEPVTKTKRARR